MQPAAKPTSTPAHGAAEAAGLHPTSQTLEQALDAFVRGVGPEPVQLKAELEALRAECDRLFLDILAAVRAAKEAGVR